MNFVAQSVAAASCGSVPLRAGAPGGTPGELAGGFMVPMRDSEIVKALPAPLAATR